MEKRRDKTPLIVAIFMFSYLGTLIFLFIKAHYGVIKDIFMPATLVVVTIPVFIYKWKLKQINNHPSNAQAKARAQDEHDNVEMFAIAVGFFAGIIGLVAALLDMCW